MRKKHRDDDFEQDEEILKPRRRKRRPAVRQFGIRRTLVLMLFVLVVLVALAPRIASLPVFRPLLLGYVREKIDGKIEIGALSMGWFAPLRVGNLRLYDAQGNLVASIASLRSEKTLSSLALNRSDLGQFEIEKPTANLVIRLGGSNLEDVLAKMMSSESSADTGFPKATIKLSDGSIQVSGPNNAPPSQLASINGELRMGGSESQITIAGSANVQGRGGIAGPIQVDGKIGTPGASTDFSGGQVAIRAENAPIDIVALALARLGQSAECQGQLTGDTTLTWSQSGESAVVDLVNIRLNQFALAAPQWLNTDRLVVQEMTAAGQIKFADSKLSADQFKCQTEFASVDATGAIDLRTIAQSLTGGPLPETDFQMGGTIDLARLTQMLPNTLRLRPGVQIQKANLVFQSFSRLEGGRRRFLVDCEAKDFAGVHDGQVIRWSKPVRLSAALAQNGPRTMLESMQVDTNSISIKGQSDIQTGQVQAAGDLGKLQTELEQFFSLGETVLAGRFDGSVNWNMPQAALATATWPITLEGKCKFESLVIALPGFDRFAEPLADVQFTASGTASRAGGIRIDAGKLDFVAGKDRLEAKLTQPIENPNWNATLLADCIASGGLDSWLQRLGPVLPALDFRAAGTLALNGAATINLSSIRLQSAQYELNEFVFDGYGMQIREPKVAGQGDVLLDWQALRMRFADITLTSSSVAGRGANLDLTFDATGFQLTGDVAYRADVNKVSQWFGVGQSPEAVHWFGSAEGTLQLTPVPGAVAGSIDSKISDLTAAKLKSGQPADANPWEILWQEPPAQLQSRLSINSTWDTIQFQHVNLQSKALQLEGQGSVSDLGRSFQLDLSGQWVPNWQAISAIAQGYAGRQIELRGQPRSETFRVQGPLFSTDTNNTALVSRQLVAETSASWESGQVLGMAIGPATLKAHLNDAVLGFDNPQIQIGPGKVYFNPLLDLRGDPQLVFAQGTILETVELTPEMCQGWLKYVAPLLAEATRARGRFSLVADGVQIPLSQPLSGRGSGQLIIEQATIEPGPLGQQLAQLVNTVKQMADGNPLESLLKSAALPTATSAETAAWLQLPPQQIGFKLEQQQIIHEHMSMNIGGVQVTTRGAIGADSSLNLVAEIPILEGWIQKQPALASLKGTAIQVPIGGTLTQPRIDQRALARLSTQMFQKAAGGQIESRLNGILNDALQKNSPQTQSGAAGVPAQPASSPSQLPPLGDSLQKSVEDNLLKGLDRLLVPKK